jgi:hypothetical protein
MSGKEMDSLRWLSGSTLVIDSDRSQVTSIFTIFSGPAIWFGEITPESLHRCFLNQVNFLLTDSWSNKIWLFNWLKGLSPGFPVTFQTNLFPDFIF